MNTRIRMMLCTIASILLYKTPFTIRSTRIPGSPLRSGAECRPQHLGAAAQLQLINCCVGVDTEVMLRGPAPIFRVGLLLVIQYMLRVRPGGEVQAGIPCNGHIWLTRSETGKSREFPHGHYLTKTCCDANCIAARACAALFIAVARGVYYTIEQPGSSVMPFLSYMRVLLKVSKAQSRRLQLFCRKSNAVPRPGCSMY